VTKDPDLSGIELNIDTTAQKVATATSSLKAHARLAGRLAILTAEKTKVANLSLPSAYYELGKQCYQTRSCEKEFPELFKDIDVVADAIEKNAMAKPLSTATTFTDKAKALAEKGVQVANKHKLAVQQKILFARLGKQAYETLGEHAGPDALIKAIEPLTARLVVLEKELAVNVQKAGGKKRVMMIVGGILVALLVVGAMLGGGTETQKGPVLFGPSSKVNTNTVTGKTFSKKEMDALFRKAKAVTLGMPEQQVLNTLGTPSESSRTDYDKLEMSPNLQAGLKAAIPTFNPNPAPLTMYGWARKGKEKNSNVKVAVQDGRVLGLIVTENGVVTVDR